MQANQNEGFQIPQFLNQLLTLRGFTSADSQKNFLYPSLSQLKDPYQMQGVDRAVDRLLKAYKDKEKICIYADFDLDGTSGLALLYESLSGLGFEHLVTFQPRRIRDGYGFHKESVDDLLAQNVQLILTVDVGITAIEAVARAQSLGIDVIITDHHLPSEDLPAAYSVINPNAGGCSSGLGYLSGVGVAFYLLRALKRRLHEEEGQNSNFTYNKEFDLKSVLDFFTIGTLTDMVPLVEDNRTLVRQGIAQFSQTQRAGLRQLLRVLNLSDKPLTSQDIAIRLAPKLNALSRMESEILPIDLMLEKDSKKARELVDFMMEQNSLRQSKQQEAEDEALGFFKDNPPQNYIFVFSKNFHQGVVGLVATKMVQKFKLPTWVGVLDEEGIIKGSSRLPDGHQGCLVESMNFASEHLTRFGGHSKAAGFELHESQAESFREKMDLFFTQIKENQNTENRDSNDFKYEFELSFKELTPMFLKWYDFAGPYGTGFPVPLFLFKSAKVRNIKNLKGGHAKLTLDQDGVLMSGLLFNGVGVEGNVEDLLNQVIDIVGEVQGNFFRGQTEVQILVKNISTGQSYEN